MASKEDIALMAHLMRRAGFGADRAEIENRAELGYEETVEELLNPEGQPPVDEHTLFRYHASTELPAQHYTGGQVNSLYYMVNTQSPLQEKMVLFWHHVFATGNSKVDNCDNMLVQMDMLRQHGMGSYRELLLQLARNPAMIFWLDNNENHKKGSQRELGARAPGAVLSRRGELHREGRL